MMKRLNATRVYRMMAFASLLLMIILCQSFSMHAQSNVVGSMSYGQVVTSTLETGSVDVWTLSITAGDTVIIAGTSNTFQLAIELYDADGNRVEWLYNLATEFIGPITLNVSGTYTIAVRINGDATGIYSLLARSMTQDQNISTLENDLSGIEIDTYSFEAQAGDVIALTLQTDRFYSGMDLYSPSRRIYNAIGYQQRNTQIGFQGPILIVQSGTYLVDVYQAGSGGEGTYTLSLTSSRPIDLIRYTPNTWQPRENLIPSTSLSIPMDVNGILFGIDSENWDIEQVDPLSQLLGVPTLYAYPTNTSLFNGLSISIATDLPTAVNILNSNLLLNLGAIQPTHSQVDIAINGRRAVIVEGTQFNWQTGMASEFLNVVVVLESGEAAILSAVMPLNSLEDNRDLIYAISASVNTARSLQVRAESAAADSLSESNIIQFGDTREAFIGDNGQDQVILHNPTETVITVRVSSEIYVPIVEVMFPNNQIRSLRRDDYRSPMLDMATTVYKSIVLPSGDSMFTVMPTPSNAQGNYTLQIDNENANRIESGDAITNEYSSTADYFLFDAEVGDRVTVRLSNNTVNAPQFWITDAWGNILVYNDRDQLANFETPSDGTYIIVYSSEFSTANSGEYTLNLTISP